ncbi:MAG: hypothetical protein ACRDPY_40765 [Streptosporangiaceae bacterium]
MLADGVEVAADHAVGSFGGALALDRGGAGILPWVAAPLVIAALVTVVAARRAAFRPDARGGASTTVRSG